MEKAIVRQIREFNRFFVRSTGLLDRYIVSSGYSLTEAHILNLIYENESTTATEINSILKLDEGYLSRTITKLVKLTLITKEQSMKDKRAYTLSLTKLGINEYLKIDSYSSDAVIAKFSHLSTEDQLRLVSCLQEVKGIVNKYDSYMQ